MLVANKVVIESSEVGRRTALDVHMAPYRSRMPHPSPLDLTEELHFMLTT